MSVRSIRKRGQRLVAARCRIDWWAQRQCSGMVAAAEAVRVAIEKLAELLNPLDRPA